MLSAELCYSDQAMKYGLASDSVDTDSNNSGSSCDELPTRIAV